eukprot:2397979-Rhodomonas_salina.1
MANEIFAGGLVVVIRARKPRSMECDVQRRCGWTTAQSFVKSPSRRAWHWRTQKVLSQLPLISDQSGRTAKHVRHQGPRSVHCVDTLRRRVGPGKISGNDPVLGLCGVGSLCLLCLSQAIRTEVLETPRSTALMAPFLSVPEKSGHEEVTGKQLQEVPRMSRPSEIWAQKTLRISLVPTLATAR